jgi:drug/metabolite transporter (DMT)-like permease
MGRSLLASPGAPLAIASAALFGANTPFAKPLLGDGVSPWLLAGLLYLGSGIGLSVVHRGRQLLVWQRRKRPFASDDRARRAGV